jgi:hypothetical protein
MTYEFGFGEPGPIVGYYDEIRIWFDEDIDNRRVRIVRVIDEFL